MVVVCRASDRKGTSFLFMVQSLEECVQHHLLQDRRGEGLRAPWASASHFHRCTQRRVSVSLCLRVSVSRGRLPPTLVQRRATGCHTVRSQRWQSLQAGKQSAFARVQALDGRTPPPATLALDAPKAQQVGVVGVGGASLTARPYTHIISYCWYSCTLSLGIEKV